MSLKFAADSMLGKLAKWLRVLGYDTHYQPFCSELVMEQCIKEGRLLLSRRESITDQYVESVLIRGVKVRDQLHEIRKSKYIISDRSKWLTRCLICNHPLQRATPEDVKDSVPEYVFYQNYKDIKFCESCGRCFWPGSHRNKIINQLEIWGF